jgi:hypothetical protein
MKALVWVLLLTGCSYWGRRPLNELKPIDPDAPVWIWIRSGVEKWHRVEITPDSVRGVPSTSRISAEHLCKMCGRSIPRAQVDSMKVGYTTWVESIFDTIAGIAFLIGMCCDIR